MVSWQKKDADFVRSVTDDFVVTVVDGEMQRCLPIFVHKINIDTKW